MKVLLTGVTSRGIGSDRNIYDYMCNVNVLAEAIRRAGHDLDHRAVSIVTDPCVEEDYDVALVGVGALNGFSSRFVLGAMHTLNRFGKRAGIFPSDGKNVAIFPASVQSCGPGGEHQCGPFPAYINGESRNPNNVLEHEEFRQQAGVGETWLANVLNKLPQTTRIKCEFPALFPLHTWGNPSVYGRAWGADATGWDPTNIAIPMQFPDTLTLDGRLPRCHEALSTERERAWVLASLQDNSAWLKKVKPAWPVVSIGNKRAVKAGAGLEYVPEDVIIRDYYGRYAGTLSFGYPLGHGGWWRMRYIHAALAGCVTCCDPNDAIPMPDSFKHSRIMLERWSNEKLAEVALAQHEDIKRTAASVDQTVETVNRFVTALKG